MSTNNSNNWPLPCHGAWIKQQVVYVNRFSLISLTFRGFYSVLEDIIIRVSTKELRVIRKYIFMME